MLSTIWFSLGFIGFGGFPADFVCLFFLSDLQINRMLHFLFLNDDSGQTRTIVVDIVE